MHYIDRLRERMPDHEARALQVGIERMVPTLRDDRDYAILVATLPESRGRWTFDTDGTGTSNGDNIWAIIRHGRIATVMYRRTAQPSTRQAFNVDIVGKARIGRE